LIAGCERRACIVVVLLGLAASVQAQPANRAAADAAFKQGRDLFKAGKFAEACAQFARSQQLDPAHGTLFNLAQCSERTGRLATAAAAYRELVAHDANAQRKATAEKRLQQLAPRVPKLVAKLMAQPDGLVLELVGDEGTRPIGANAPVEVDLGDYNVVARAPGYATFTRHVKIDQEAQRITLGIALEPITVAPVAAAPSKPARSRRTLIGIGAVATGGAAVIAGGIFGALARSTWSDARDVCGGTSCTTPAELDRANELGDRARTRATLSTAFIAGGAALAAVGAYLWITAPAGARIAPTVGEGGAGVAISGAF
jgi:hypothetical protein